jgi:hypothetical protein
MFIKIHLKKICCFINFLFKLKIYVNFYWGVENRNIQRMIYLHFSKNLSNIEIFCLFVSNKNPITSWNKWELLCMCVLMLLGFCNEFDNN